MGSTDLQTWITHLRAIARPAARAMDRFGAGALDGPFAAAVLGAPAPPRPETLPTGEIALWWALVDSGIDVDAAIAATTEGSLFPQGLYRTIEVWTEGDLCGLHALWTLARRHDRPDWRRRVDSVRDWHLLNTQPDNATNRPWALHVFLLGGTPESRLYAETLLHNCMAMEGRPDPLSAWILLDAADRLEAERLSGR